MVWRSLCIFSILLALLLGSLTLSVELAPTIQLHSTDSPYAYDNSLRGLYCLTRRFIRVFSYLVWVIILIVVGLGTDWTSLSRARVLLGNVLKLIFWPLGIFLEVNGLWFLLLGLSFLSSFFPSTSRIVGGPSLQRVSGCFSRLLAISLSSIL